MFRFSRLLIIYAIAAPLALLLGYLVGSWNGVSLTSPGLFFVAMVVSFFALPVFLKWHHTMLILLWNAAFIVFFLPSQPDIWFVAAAISFSIALLNHILFQKKFLRAPELTRPLILFSIVVAVTMYLRGGLTLHSLGGGAVAGGRYYIFLFVAVAGYFALTAEPIPISAGPRLGGLFFLSGLTNCLPNIVFALGPAFYFLYLLLPTGGVMFQASVQAGVTDIDRIAGLGTASGMVICFMFCRYGLRGILDLGKPWRLFLLLLVAGASFFGGFRSQIVFLFFFFAFQFFFEGLLRTHYFPIVLALAIFSFVPIVAFSNHMPGSVQRAISFLPVNVDSEVLEDAKGSSEWRWNMWAEVVKQVPKYLLLGKGYGMDTAELTELNDAMRYGVPIPVSGYETFIMAGDYHSGPLSVVMPFGIFGVITFGWVLFGGYKVLYSNYRYGDSKLRRVNTTLLSYYLVSCISFIFIFGALNSQLYMFLGLCGLSVSLNGGVKRKAAVRPQRVAVSQSLALQAG